MLRAYALHPRSRAVLSPLLTSCHKTLPGFVQQRYARGDAIHKRTVPFLPKREDDSPGTTHVLDHGWEESREDLILESDKFMKDQFNSHPEDNIFEHFGLTDFKQSKDSEAKIEEKIAAMPTPTVAEDFNERQQKYGTYGDDPHTHPIRATLNRSERGKVFSWKEYTDPHLGSRLHSELRIKKSGSKVPSLMQIVLDLMHPGPSPQGFALDKQKVEALRIVAKHMHEPEIIAQLTQPKETVARLQKQVDEIMKDHEAYMRKFESVSVVPDYTEEIPEDVQEQLEAPPVDLEKPEALESAATETNSEVTQDSGATAVENVQEIIQEEFKEEKTGMEALFDALGEDYKQKRFNPNSFFTNGWVTGENPFYMTGDWLTREERFPKMDTSIVNYDDSVFFGNPSRSLSSLELLTRKYTPGKLTESNFIATEENPYCGDATVLFVSMGRGGNIGIPDRATLRRAQLIREGLLQRNKDSKEKSSSELIDDIVKEKTGGRTPGSGDDPLSFLDNFDVEAAMEEKQKLIAERKAKEQKQIELARQNRMKKLEDQKSEWESLLGEAPQKATQKPAQKTSQKTDTERKAYAEDDEIDYDNAELERILLNADEEEEQQEEKEDPEFKEVLHTVAEKKERFRLPSYDELDIEKVLEKGGTTTDIQRSLERYLLQEVYDDMVDDVPENHKISKEEDLVSGQEFVSKIQQVYGDNPPEDIYNQGIISYVRSEHLRQAMFLVQSMKDHNLYPSEDAYSAIVEGFYSNFDITGGDFYRNEMLTKYPDSNPPVLELSVDKYLKPAE